VSVWLHPKNAAVSLTGNEGALVSISITVEPQDLEDLLEALAHLDYPINPQIYHQAAVVSCYPDGREVPRPTTIVEFPAYVNWVSGVRTILGLYGFDPANLYVASMLEELHSEAALHPAPEGALFTSVRLLKTAPLAMTA
jgi:hypothetical protein